MPRASPCRRRPGAPFGSTWPGLSTGTGSSVRVSAWPEPTPRRSTALGADPGDVEYLDVEDLLALAAGLLGDPPPIRDLGLLGSAAARPAASAFGEEAYSDLWLKGAALLQSLVKNHPLIDGNKRLGWLSTAVFLEVNGVAAARATNDDVYDLVIHVAGSQRSVEAIAAGLRRILP